MVWKHSLPPAEKTKSPWSKARQVASASTLTDAIHAADTFAATKFERIFINTSSSWRKGPASEGQLAFLNKIRRNEGKDLDLLTADDVTKGLAGDMITKIKFGATGRFDKMVAAKRKESRVVEKLEQSEDMRKRETVKVGPLET